MPLTESIEAIAERLQGSANVASVYGDPISADDRTVIPVAKVSYGFGVGYGSGEENRDESRGEGGGGGGGVTATPVGALEISDRETRFIRFASWKRLATAFGIGLLVGSRLGRRGR